ncbi:MAG: S8 family serine peptidase [Sulfolobales archaeon]
MVRASSQGSDDLGVYISSLATLRLARFENNMIRSIIVPVNITSQNAERILQSLGIKIVDKLDLVEGFVAYLSISDIRRIETLYKGSLEIYPDIEVKLLRDSLFDPVTESKGLDTINVSQTNIEYPYAPNASRYLVQAPEMWAEGFTGRGVRIAVIDTGIQSRHPWLVRPDNTSVVAWHYDVTNDTMEYCSFHGTHVAGIIAAQYNSLQVAGIGANYTYPGIAPDSTIYDIKVFNSSYDYCESTLSSWIIKGIQAALVGPDGKPGTGDEADIISMSIGGLVPPYILPLLSTHPLIRALSQAVSAGKLVVIAAGNSGPGGYTINFMCAAQGVICVAAAADQWSTSLDTLFTAFFSSRGPVAWYSQPLMVSAPGVFIISSIPTDYKPPYIAAAASGTSMATPHVSGVLALLKQAMPTASSGELIMRLANSAYLYKNTGVFLSDRSPWNRFVSGNTSILAIGDPYKEPNPFVEGFGLVRAYDSLRTNLVAFYPGGDLMRSLVIEPGSNTSASIYIRNLGSRSLSVSVSIVGFESYASTSSIRSYVSVSQPSLVLSQGSSGEVRITISIPEGVLPGVYPGYIVAEGRTPSGETYTAKVVLVVVVPLKIDATFVESSPSSIAGLSAESAYYFGPPSPEWIMIPLEVVKASPDPILIRFSSSDSLVNLYIEEGVLVSPQKRFDNILQGNLVLNSEGIYYMFIGWVTGAYDIGTLDIYMRSTTSSREYLSTIIQPMIRSLIQSMVTPNISTLIARLNSLEENLSIIASYTETSYRELQGIIGDMNRSIIELYNSLNSHSVKLQEIDATLSSLNKTVSDLNLSMLMNVAELRTFANTLQNDLKSMSSRVSNLELGYSSLSQSLNTSIADIESRVDRTSMTALASLIIALAGVVLGVVVLVIVFRRKT